MCNMISLKHLDGSFLYFRVGHDATYFAQLNVDTQKVVAHELKA
jgi:hypothetical protein